MEDLIRKYIKYFYIAVLIAILVHLISSIIAMLMGVINCRVIVLIVLSIVNIMILSNSMKYNLKQQFTECKVNLKILRFTLGLGIILHGWEHFNIFTVTDYALVLSMVEGILIYRIKCIEHLENLANKLAKSKIVM